MMAAARLPARSEPAKSQLRRPSDGPDQVLDVVVVHRQGWIVEEAGQRGPTLEAVVEGPGRCGTIGELDALQRHPFMPGVRRQDGWSADGPAAAQRAGIPDQPLDLVDLLDEFERGGRQGALAGFVQLKNLRRACARQPTSVTPFLNKSL